MGNSLWRYLKTCHVNAPTLLLISIIKAISRRAGLVQAVESTACDRKVLGSSRGLLAFNR